MSNVRPAAIPANEFESEWRLLREAAAIARCEYGLATQRLRAEADRFEIAKQRLEIAEILEARSLARLESYRRGCANEVIARDRALAGSPREL